MGCSRVGAAASEKAASCEDQPRRTPTMINVGPRSTSSAWRLILNFLLLSLPIKQVGIHIVIIRMYDNMIIL